MATRRANILILCKTYPSPSKRYAETSYVAGMEETGRLIRLYPVPFRFLTEEQKFIKWQWINARIEKTRAIIARKVIASTSTIWSVKSRFLYAKAGKHRSGIS